ncbi:MAG: DUF429 domain-containing protein [Chloroflexi bacterium]|nr:DUF429 domain-containing protein [Chloroflexota bacterium]
MIYSDKTFVGIDPTSGNNSFTYAALDHDLNLIALADGELDDLTVFISAQKSVVAAVNAPAGISRGFVREALKKKAVKPHQLRSVEMRVAEYELRERGINIAGTPANEGLCFEWVKAGFEVYRKLGKMGFKKYPRSDLVPQILETNSHACFSVLAGQIPLAKPSLEGRLQRQLILYERGLGIKDPMDFFEEITRYKLSKGIWPMELLYFPGQLDALAAAYTAWLAVNKPEHISMIGDAKEGMIVLPEKELKEKY